MSVRKRNRSRFDDRIRTDDIDVIQYVRRHETDVYEDGSRRLCAPTRPGEGRRGKYEKLREGWEETVIMCVCV